MWEHQTIEFKPPAGGTYSFDPVKFVETLNQKAREGWELVSTFKVRDGMSLISDNVIAVLRRKTQAGQ